MALISRLLGQAAGAVASMRSFVVAFFESLACLYVSVNPSVGLPGAETAMYYPRKYAGGGPLFFCSHPFCDADIGFRRRGPTELLNLHAHCVRRFLRTDNWNLEPCRDA